MKKSLLVVGIMFVSTFVPLTVSAYEENASGGNWSYGVTLHHQVYSNYFHNHKKHGSSVINYNGDYKCDKDVPVGQSSKVSLPSGRGTDSSYYQIN